MTQPDKLFKEKLEVYESPAPLTAWDKIESNLDRRSNKGLWMKIAAGLALLAIALFAWYTTSTSTDQVEQLANEDSPVKPKQEQTIPPVAEQTPEREVAEKSMIASDVKERQPSSSKATDTQVNQHNTASTLIAQAETQPEQIDPVQTEPIEVETYVITEQPATSTAQASIKSESNVIIYSAEEVNLKYLKKNLDSATSEVKKPSGIQRLITIAADLKNTEGGMGELRDKKNEILALNFRKNNEAKNN